jgi:hypothetical protein
MKKILIFLTSLIMTFSSCDTGIKNEVYLLEGKALFKVYVAAAIADGLIEDKKFDKVVNYADESIDYLDLALEFHEVFMAECHDEELTNKCKYIDKSIMKLLKKRFINDNSEDYTISKSWDLILNIFEKLPSSSYFKFEKFEDTGKEDVQGIPFSVKSARSKHYPDFILDIGESRIKTEYGLVDPGQEQYVFFRVYYDEKIDL